MVQESDFDKLLAEIIKNPQDDGFYIEKCKNYILNNDYKSALELYKALLVINPLNFEALVNAGSLSYYLNDFDTAINLYYRAMEIETDNFYIYFNLANIFCDLKQYDDANLYYNKALALNFDNYLVYSSLGLMFQEMNNLSKAKMFYEQAISEKNDLAEAYVNYARVLFLSEDYELALKNYEIAYNLAPDDIQIPLYIANIYSVLTEFKKADEYFEIIEKDKKESYQYYICKGLSLYDRGNNIEALNIYKKAAEINPDNYNVYVLIGNIYSLISDLDNALLYYKKANEKFPDNSKIISLIANVYALKGDLKSAIALYRNILDVENDDSEIKLIYYELINCLIKQKKYKEEKRF